MRNYTQTASNRFNKKIYSLLITLIFSVSVSSQNVAINANGAQPNVSAGLDIDFPDKGLLIPRLSLTSTSSFAPLSAHVAGMIVYNLATVSDVIPGFYCNNGSKWVSGFLKGQSIGDMMYWSGTEWMSIPIGVPGQYLQISGTFVPTWGGNVFATLSTTVASAITSVTAISGGNIVSDGGSSILSRGVCWNSMGAPTIANSKTTDASGLGVFSSSITGLLSGKRYYARAYAMNATVINYGNEITFTTLASAPSMSATTAASAITGNTATSGGNVTADGGSPITERGLCWATTANPTTAAAGKVFVANPIPGFGSFTGNLTGLSGGTLYYVRAYAINNIGTAYGAQISFTTTVLPPTLVTVAASNITGASAASGASMNWNGGGYQNYQNYGIAYSTAPNSATPTYVSTNTTNYSVNPLVNITPWVTNLTGLAANTTYYIRGFLYVYKAGWSYVYGNELSFTTSGPTAPVVASTTAITGLSANTANSGGAITSDGGSAITAKGVCWGTSASPILGSGNFTTNGTGNSTFTSNITGLTASTTYYIRAYATNSIGTSYGPTDVSFTTWVQAPYILGQMLDYGTVAYIAPDGSGFIVSPDIASTAPWGCSGISIAGATGTAIGTGLANTNAILAACTTRPIAASVAKDYNGGGFTDWYLPSTGEWSQLLNSAVMNWNYRTSNTYYTSTQTSATMAGSYFTNYNTPYYAGSSKAGDAYAKTLFAIRNFSPATPAVVTTAAITNIGAGSATGGGNVTNDGGAPILAAGVCWSNTTTPTIANSKTTDGFAIGSFISNISGLSLATSYSVRAYVTTIAGTTYGSEVSFTTAASASALVVTTDVVTSTSGTDATGGGNVSSDGGDAVTSYGVCWSASPSPTTADFKTTDGSGIGTFISSLTGLTAGTIYYIRAYAINGIGTSYGNEVSFGSGLPAVVTELASVISAGSIASIYSYVSNDAGNAVTETGICWGTVTGPTIADSHIADLNAQYNFNSNLNNLTVGLTYYVRAYAINSAGLAYSNEISFIATAAIVGQTITTSTGWSGVIISTNGTNGLIATSSDMGIADWACSSSLPALNTSTALGSGMSNTTAILADYSTQGCTTSPNTSYGYIAAQLPGLLIGTEWYLPSKDEVDVIYSSLGTTNLPVTGLQIWSSSQFDTTHAWFFDGTTWQSNGLKSDDTKSVWPIRSF